AAAGAAGLIKTVFALEHEQIPPVLHFAEPNSKLELSDSAFAIADRLLPWKRGDRLRRAGVSSFGMGGTNAHVVVEEAPVATPGTAPRQKHQVLLLSARTEAALNAATDRLLAYLEQHP